MPSATIFLPKLPYAYMYLPMTSEHAHKLPSEFHSITTSICTSLNSSKLLTLNNVADKHSMVSDATGVPGKKSLTWTSLHEDLAIGPSNCPFHLGVPSCRVTQPPNEPLPIALDLCP